MRSRRLCFNGVDGETGRFLFPPTSPRELAAVARGECTDRDEIGRLEHWLEQLEAQRLHRLGLHPGKLEQAGWGVIFAAADPTVPAVREALSELLAHRRAQAGRVHEQCYQEFVDDRAYRRGESKSDFLARHGVGPGAANGRRMPYYLLIVGDPEGIPWSFQRELDVRYAVGRICFDTTDEYASYARSVVAAETSPPPRRRRAVLFAPRHSGDSAAGLAAVDLATSLAERLPRHRPAWEVATAFGAQATKVRLASLIKGSEEAALIFTAGHGLGYPSGHPLQRDRQGALLCQEFPGFGRAGGRVEPEHCFAADDVGATARLNGLVSFHFACYSAGAPAIGDFPHGPGAPLPRVAPRAFLSRLAQRLLGHSRGGALAVVGQVEKAWRLAIEWPPQDGRSPAELEEAFNRLFAGEPVGYAMATFGERYAELSSDLAAELEVARYGLPLDERTLARLWIGRNECRGYVVAGDPAVRLATEAEPDSKGEPDPPRGAAIH